MVNCRCGLIDGAHRMHEGLWPVLAIIAIVIVYTIAKVVDNMRKSERQWREVDKSKLREWRDDEED